MSSAASSRRRRIGVSHAGPVEGFFPIVFLHAPLLRRRCWARRGWARACARRWQRLPPSGASLVAAGEQLRLPVLLEQVVEGLAEQILHGRPLLDRELTELPRGVFG